MNAQTDTTLALALALEGSAVPASDEIKRLAGIASMLETLPDPEIDPRFAARLEARLMAEMAEEAAPARPLQLVKAEPAVVVPPASGRPAERPAPNVIALPRRRFVVRKLVAAAIAAAMMMALPVVAAANSRPGSPFFAIEQWRQNHAISQAHGAAKAFLMERTAQRWFGYAAEGVTLGDSRAQLERILSYANGLQGRAAALITQIGTPAQIERMRRMLADDFSRLNEMLPAAPAGTRLVVHDALQAIQLLSNKLAQALGLPAQPLPVGATLRILPAVGGESSQSGPSGSNGSPGQGGTQPNNPAPAPNPGQNISIDPGCDILFSEMTGDLLSTASTGVCKAKNEYQEKTGK